MAGQLYVKIQESTIIHILHLIAVPDLDNPNHLIVLLECCLGML